MIYRLKQQLRDMNTRVRPTIRGVHRRLKIHWRKILLFGGIGLFAMAIIFQLLYPTNRLVPFTAIDGLNFSGWQKSDVIKQLDSRYMKSTIPIYFGHANQAYRSPKPADIGLTIKNETRINEIDYPWYLRLVPSSVLWAHFITERGTEPTYNRNDAVLIAYMIKELGESCDVKPIDASLKYSGGKFEVVPSHPGGTCDINNVKKVLSAIKPHFKNTYRLTIPVKEIAPSVSDKMAQQFADNLQTKVDTGVSLSVNGTPQVIPAGEILGWMDFSSIDGNLTYAFNPDRAAIYLNKEVAPKVAVAAGVSTVNTYNFTVTSRVEGVTGRRLDIGLTLGSLKSFLDGAVSQAITQTAPLAPSIVYKRSYSNTDVGLSALMQQYAEAHPGVFGVSLIELSGQNRRASYNDSKIFTTASTYKLFVAYSTLKRVEEGSWHWTDPISGGRDLTTCFDDMIVKSDNACASALLTKVGYTNVTNEAHAIGCNSTSFLGSNGIKTTPADLALFLAQLQTGQILTQQSSRDILLGAMKRNIYRRGIPAGIGGSVVADKVGFLDGLLHDASIVYSPTGTYVLVIMTDGSSWATIADLAGQIEALCTQ